MTRAIAFAVDAIVITFVAMTVELATALIVTVLHLPSELKKVLVAVGAGLFVLWTIGYFVGFWATTGQTPGNRLMRFRILTAKGDVQKPRRALLRCGALLLAALPLFAGFLLILFDDRRRGLHDRLVWTVAVEAPDLSVAERRRARRRASGVAGSPDPDDARGPNGAHADGERERLTFGSAAPLGPLGRQ